MSITFSREGDIAEAIENVLASRGLPVRVEVRQFTRFYQHGDYAAVCLGFIPPQVIQEIKAATRAAHIEARSDYGYTGLRIFFEECK